MPCSICQKSHRLLHGRLCAGCSNEARNLIALVDDCHLDHLKPSSGVVNLDHLKPSSGVVNLKPFENLSKWISNLAKENEEQKKKLDFLGKSFLEFREETFPDIHLKPADGGPCFPGHKAMLAARSEVLKNVLGSGRSNPTISRTIAFSEFNGEELESFLEFLYTGSLSREKLDKHAYSLSIAADKYKIAYLLEVCEDHIMQSLNEANVLEALDFADAHKKTNVKEACMRFLMDNKLAVVSSATYLEWALKNPALSVEVTKAFVLSPTTVDGSKRQRLESGPCKCGRNKTVPPMVLYDTTDYESGDELA